MQTKVTIERLILRCRYKPGRSWRVLDVTTGYLLQHVEGSGEPCHIRAGRKWYISEYATDSEVVQTALLAALQFEEHEAREAFRFDGERIYGPHIDAISLAAVCRTLDIRKREG